MANTKLPARLLDTSAIPALNVTGDLTVDTTTLKVDSTNNRVGIGIASPKTTLNVAANNSGQGPILTLENTDTSITTGDVIGQIDFYANDGSSNGTGPKVNIKAVAQSGAGTVTELTFGTSPSSSATAIEHMRIDAAGQVGIGTDNPGQTLEIHNSDASDYTDFGLRGTGHKYVIGVGNDSVSTVNDKLYIYDNDNTAFRMVVDTSGKVGIGTSSPATNLHVSTTSSHSEIRVSSSASGSGTVPAVSLNNTEAEWGMGILGDNHLHFRENTASYASRLTIADGGNVGIGMTNPTAKLHLDNPSAFTNMIEYGNVTWNQNSGHGLVAINRGSDGYVQLQLTSGVDNADVFTIRNSGTGANVQHNLLSNGNVYHAGKVGIGINNPATNLHVYGTDPVIRVSDDGTSGFSTLELRQQNTNSEGFEISYNSGTGHTHLNNVYSSGDMVFGTSTTSFGTTSTNVRMRIKSNGHVLMPYQPSFKIAWVTRNATGAGRFLSTNAGDSVASGRDQHNTGNHFSTATGKFTAPVAGTYLLGFQAMRNGSNGTLLECRIKKNGALMWARAYQSGFTHNHQYWSIVTITNCSVGDYFQVFLHGDTSIYDDDTYFYGHLMG